MAQIDEVLNRRADLSTFVVHLTRDSEWASAREALESILRGRMIEAKSEMGWAQSEFFDEALPITEVGGQSQKVVSFSETPLEHIFAMFADISGRLVQLQPYGLAFTKMVMRRRGANPVWYVDRTAGALHEWLVPNALNELTEIALDHPDDEASIAIGKVLPFFEVVGTWPSSQKEFWWEREWRHVGDFTFSLDQVALWLAPESEHVEWREILRNEWERDEFPEDRLPRFIDPNWSLERMVARLARLRPGDVTPFSHR